MPRVSVIMGVYNVKSRDMAKEAIDSILEQTFKDFEFIICDDGSDNDTWSIISELVKNDTRVKMIRNAKNMGLAYSLNRCLEIADGEYIARMDADDISYINRLEKQVEFLDSNPEYALVSTCSDLFNEKGICGARKRVEVPTKKDFLFGPPVIHAAMMARAEAVKNCQGYRVDWDTVRAEDYDLFMRMYAAGYKIYNMQENLYKIREDEDAYRRRSYKHRIEEAHVRLVGFKLLGLYPIGIIYVIKPLIVGLIPQKVLAKLRKDNN